MKNCVRTFKVRGGLLSGDLKSRGWRRRLLVASLAVGWAALSPSARATCQDGCLGNFDTALGENALANVSGGTENVAVGYQAFVQNTTGFYNTAIGTYAGYVNVSGSANTAVGHDVMGAFDTVSSSNNTGVGAEALVGPSGNNNTAVGYSALMDDYQGANNAAVGASALAFNVSGNNNTAVGYEAMFGDQVNGSSGSNNTAMGYEALFSDTTGGSNTANGYDALYFNTTGSFNTATGRGALYKNTASNNTATGYQALNKNTSGGGNTANGYQTLFSNITGYSNTATGSQSLYHSTGTSNTATGQATLYNNTTGGNNTANGLNALFSNTIGSNNIAIGGSAGYYLTTGSNNIDIGNVGVAAESATVRIGTSGTQTNTYIAGINGVTVAGGIGVIVDSSGHLGTIVSAARYKENIQPMDKASEAILSLQPVTFRYKKELDPKAIPQFGLVAEQVEKVDPDLVAKDSDGKPYSVRYEAVNAMLLNEFLKEYRKVEQLETALACQTSEFQTALAKQRNEQQDEITALTKSLKGQAAQLQQMSARITTVEANPRVVATAR